MHTKSAGQDKTLNVLIPPYLHLSSHHANCFAE